MHAPNLPALCLAAAALVASGVSASDVPDDAGDRREAAAAQTDYLPQGMMGYEVFEASLDHVDLAACPDQFDPDAVFCRMTLAAERAHVFVFSFDGAQPLLAVRHYDLDDDFLPF